MKFTKLQATGNDFILIDARGKEDEWGELARAMCHRRLGVGGDGLIVVTTSSRADTGMRIFNPDGSEAEVCGNGLRCLAKYVVDRKIVSKSNLAVDTPSGIRKVEVFSEAGKVKQARVAMGTPRFRPKEIPIRFDLIKTSHKEINPPILDYSIVVANRELVLSFVSMGNPHTVTFLTTPVADFPLTEIGPQVETHILFPKRTNFEIARVVSSEKIEARVWERGVGETLSCGSGACAIGVVACLKDYASDFVDIMLPGGILTVTWDGVGEVWLSGQVAEVFSGEWLK